MFWGKNIKVNETVQLDTSELLTKCLSIQTATLKDCDDSKYYLTITNKNENFILCGLDSRNNYTNLSSQFIVEKGMKLKVEGGKKGMISITGFIEGIDDDELDEKESEEVGKKEELKKQSVKKDESKKPSVKKEEVKLIEKKEEEKKEKSDDEKEEDELKKESAKKKNAKKESAKKESAKKEEKKEDNEELNSEEDVIGKDEDENKKTQLLGNKTKAEHPIPHPEQHNQPKPQNQSIKTPLNKKGGNCNKGGNFNKNKFHQQGNFNKGGNKNFNKGGNFKK